jgi:hypothetical protein
LEKNWDAQRREDEMDVRGYISEKKEEGKHSACKPWIHAAIYYLGFTNVIVLILSGA